METEPGKLKQWEGLRSYRNRGQRLIEMIADFTVGTADDL